MRHLLHGLLAAALLVSAPRAQATQEPSVELPAPLQKVLSDYEDAWQNRGDGSRLAGLFVEDGYALPPGRPPVRGRAALRALHGGGSGSPLSLRALAYGIDGNQAYIIGAFSRNRGEPDRGKYVLVLRKEADGEWRIVADIENTNVPPR